MTAPKKIDGRKNNGGHSTKGFAGRKFMPENERRQVISPRIDAATRIKITQIQKKLDCSIGVTIDVAILQLYDNIFNK